jgi:hypothetical protein
VGRKSKGSNTERADQATEIERTQYQNIQEGPDIRDRKDPISEYTGGTRYQNIQEGPDIRIYRRDQISEIERTNIRIHTGRTRYQR